MATTHDAMKNAVNVRAQASCPMCTQDTWLGGGRLAELWDGDGGPPIEALVFVCAHCGFVRLHAIQALATIDD